MCVILGSSSASFKMSATKKWWKTSVRPTLIITLEPTIFNRFCLYLLQLLLIFEDLVALSNFMNTHWPVWGTAFITTLQPTIFKWSYWYFAQSFSWVGAWTILIMTSLFPFSRILWNFEILWIHIDWCLSLDSLLSYSWQFSCILFIFITVIGLT